MTLRELIETAGYTASSESGRGSMGNPCLGVRLDARDTKGFFAALVKVASDLFTGAYPECSSDGLAALEEIRAALENHRTDAMGHGTVILFPGRPAPSEDDEED